MLINVRVGHARVVPCKQIKLLYGKTSSGESSVLTLVRELQPWQGLLSERHPSLQQVLSAPLLNCRSDIHLSWRMEALDRCYTAIDGPLMRQQMGTG